MYILKGNYLCILKLALTFIIFGLVIQVCFIMELLFFYFDRWKTGICLCNMFAFKIGSRGFISTRNNLSLFTLHKFAIPCILIFNILLFKSHILVWIRLACMENFIILNLLVFEIAMKMTLNLCFVQCLTNHII